MFSWAKRLLCLWQGHDPVALPVQRLPFGCFRTTIGCSRCHTELQTVETLPLPEICEQDGCSNHLTADDSFYLGLHGTVTCVCTMCAIKVWRPGMPFNGLESDQTH